MWSWVSAAHLLQDPPLRRKRVPLHIVRHVGAQEQTVLKAAKPQPSLGIRRRRTSGLRFGSETLPLPADTFAGREDGTEVDSERLETSASPSAEKRFVHEGGETCRPQENGNRVIGRAFRPAIHAAIMANSGWPANEESPSSSGPVTLRRFLGFAPRTVSRRGRSGVVDWGASPRS
jgi:hypothetical protein